MLLSGYCHLCQVRYDESHICPKPEIKFLHQQIYEIADKCGERFNPAWTRGVSFPRLVTALVEHAFAMAWDPHHRNCIIIRTAFQAINENKWSYEMPAYP